MVSAKRMAEAVVRPDKLQILAEEAQVIVLFKAIGDNSSPHLLDWVQNAPQLGSNIHQASPACLVLNRSHVNLSGIQVNTVPCEPLDL